MILWILSSFVMVVLAGGTVLFVLGYGFGTIADYERHDATLTCFHCGRETETGRKRCQWCKEELQ